MSEVSPLVQLLDSFKRIFETAEILVAKHREPIIAFSKFFIGLDKVDEAGWLPHELIDLSNVAVQPDSSIQGFIEALYREASFSIEQQLLENLRGGGWSELAVGPLEDAVSAHRNGHYRATTRLVFPALEALERTALASQRWGSQTRLPMLRKAILSDGSAVSFPQPMLLYFKLWEKLHSHCLENVNTAEAFERFSASQIPNRHACIHGLIDYRTFQHSLNSLILAGYVLQMIQLVRSQKS